MKTVVVGPGAVGCLFASFFASAGEDVWLLDKSPDRARQIAEKGVHVEGIGGQRDIPVNATADTAEIGKVDLVLICVKAFDTHAAAESVKPILNNETVVMTLQNGYGNVERISEAVGEKHALGGTTAQGATLLGVGHIRHAGNGETTIGEINGSMTDRLKNLRTLFEKCGIATKLTDNLDGLIWSKLVINVGINALTAIARLRNGKLVEYEGTRDVLRDAVEEAVAVASKDGVKLLFDDPVGKVEDVCRATAANVASMFQDVLRKKSTEVDFINGAVVRRAEELGMSVPVNLTLTRLVKTIQESYSDQVDNI